MQQILRTRQSLAVAVALLIAALIAVDFGTAQGASAQTRSAVRAVQLLAGDAPSGSAQAQQRAADEAPELPSATLSGRGGHQDQQEHQQHQHPRLGAHAVTLRAPVQQPCERGCAVRPSVVRGPTASRGAREAVPQRRSIELPLLHQVFRC